MDTATVREDFLRAFDHCIAKAKYGLVDEEPYQIRSLPYLFHRNFIDGRRVEVTAEIRELNFMSVGEKGRPSYEGVLFQGQSSIPFRRSDETILSEIYRDPLQPGDRIPFTGDQYYLELRCLRGWEGTVTVRGQLQQKGAERYLSVERLVGFGEEYLRDVA